MSAFAKLKKEKAEKVQVDEEDDDEEEEEVEEKPTAPKEEEKEVDTSLANSDVTTKYQEAAKIAQSTLLEIVAMCLAGASVVEICKTGDALIEQKASLIFRQKTKKASIEKGIAFPVCLSVNECVCHNSPLVSEDSAVLADGDMVKIDLGVHVDGFIAVVAHTMVVGLVATPEAPIVGKRASVMMAGYLAAELAAKMIKPGATNKQVADAVRKVAELYGVQVIAGTSMHQMKQYVIDGNKSVIVREEPDQKMEPCTFEQFEVYGVDVAVSTGEGKPREMDARTTIFKRAVDKTYKLRSRNSRVFYSDVTKRFPTLPFTLRAFSDEKAARMGVREPLTHQLLSAYPVLYERVNEEVAHFKFTVLLLPSGSVKVTGLTLPEGLYSCPDKQLPEDIAAILATQIIKKKKKKRSKKAAAAAGEAEGGAEADGEEEG